ncbi:Y-family DNA polymerase [Novilysobacter spongiicola]|uniref:DNA polymerase V n=1 Tax=Lysobacter spongiicola DSM 21749 TaxID=1122188 RepID=A0A1T4RFA9_9GAMM|nr:Y-family DNA polymerase [Lysobacter spongiicola]SKA14692.1 DNA polymerase V [Lysobacter spongiicola DSM 21749]
MFGLIDGNAFYCSVERVFNPALHGEPVAVLSSNDGCAIARSAECKALGVKMGQPIHEVSPEVRRRLKILSANFALYGDMSGRVVSVLRDLFPSVEVYSIDESFVDMTRVPDRLEAGREARSRVLQWTGIPTCVGIGPTKTLAKLANKLAKSTPQGVVQALPESSEVAAFPVEDVWGVGRKWASRLGAEGILTAGDLVEADPETLRARYGVVLARTQRELQGVVCAELEETEPQRKQIVVSRSFGREVASQEDLAQAVATFAVRACEKLRARSLQAGGVWVWLHTNPFKTGAKQYHPSKAMQLIHPSSDTREVLAVARSLVRSMYRQGYAYKKAGVGLLDLSHGDVHQADLFSGMDPRSAKLMAVMDQANRRFGRGSMSLASAARRPGQSPKWAMRQESLSPAYTTRWDQLLKVR